VRTHQYDDYNNNIDELIFDSETKQPFAAIDDTTNIFASKEKGKTFYQNIKNGGKVKYGVELHDEGVGKKSYTNLPVFAIALDAARVLSLAKDLIDDDKISDDNKEIEQDVLNSLRNQSSLLEKAVTDENVKSAYKMAGQIFAKL